MPLYAFHCPECAHKFDRFLRLAEYQTPQGCGKCGALADRQVTAAAIVPDYAPYQCPVTGKLIDGRKAHQENLKRHGCRVLEPGEKEATERMRAQEDAELDKAVEATTEQFIESLPTRKKEQLVAEVQAGMDVTFERI